MDMILSVFSFLHLPISRRISFRCLSIYKTLIVSVSHPASLFPVMYELRPKKQLITENIIRVLQAEAEEIFEPASYNRTYQYQTVTRWYMRLTLILLKF